MSLNEFSSLSVPFKNIRGLLDKNRKLKLRKIRPKCLSPWCRFTGTNNGLVKLGLYIGLRNNKSNKYEDVTLCEGCWIKYGLNKENNKWESYNKEIMLIKELKLLYKSGYSISKIRDTTNVALYKVYKYLGYLFLNNLLSFEGSYYDINQNITEQGMLNGFKKISPINERTMHNKSDKYLGWSRLETSYYYWHPTVQHYINFEMIYFSNEKVNYIRNNLEDIIFSGELTVEKVAKRFSIGMHTLRNYKLTDDISAMIEKRKSESLEKEYTSYRNKIKNYVLMKRKQDERIFSYNLYQQIDRPEPYLIKYHKKLLNYFDDILEEEKKIDEIRNKKKIKNAIIYLYLKNKSLNLFNISKYSKLSNYRVKKVARLEKGLQNLVNGIINDMNKTR